MQCALCVFMMSVYVQVCVVSESVSVFACIHVLKRERWKVMQTERVRKTTAKAQNTLVYRV